MRPTTNESRNPTSYCSSGYLQKNWWRKTKRSLVGGWQKCHLSALHPPRTYFCRGKEIGDDFVDFDTFVPDWRKYSSLLSFYLKASLSKMTAVNWNYIFEWIEDITTKPSNGLIGELNMGRQSVHSWPLKSNISASQDSSSPLVHFNSLKRYQLVTMLLSTNLVHRLYRSTRVFRLFHLIPLCWTIDLSFVNRILTFQRFEDLFQFFHVWFGWQV